MRVQLTRPPWAKGGIAATFPYDPAILAVVKRVPGRTWNKAHHAWVFPATPENVQVLLGSAPSLGYTVAIEERLSAFLGQRRAQLTLAANAKAAGDGSIAFDYVTQPYAHQRAGLDFLARLGSGALLWEMGLGKTKTAIDYCEWLRLQDADPDFFRVLVICPNTVKSNWLAEIAKHAGHHNADAPIGTLVERSAALGLMRYTVVNCEALSLDPLASAIVAYPWSVVIVDESTRFKEPTAKRTKRLLKMKPAHRIILSGLPTPNGPQDAWSQFEWIEPGLFGSWWSFTDRYLVKNWFGAIEGIKPGAEGELAKRIESRSYRILKADVLDLPAKVYEDRRVEMGPEQRRYYDAMKRDLRVIVEDRAISATTILTQLLRLTQITAGLVGEGDDYTWLADNAKVRELDTLLNEELAGKQVVVFGIYQRELEHLAMRYGVSPKCIIYGPTSPTDRSEAIERFQRGADRILLVQSRTGGIGINLTAAQYAVYYTRGWSLEDYAQSQDRLHRIGQQGTVTIIHLVAEGSVDDQIAAALADKSRMSAILTGDAARALANEVLGVR